MSGAKQEKPLISVLMSVFNGKPYLSEAVESILHQTFADFEFIIIDDGSSDGTTEILEEYAEKDSRIRLIRNDGNIGLTRSLNKGIQVASGKFIARQDADDVSLPERFEKQLHRFADDERLALLGSAYEVIDGEGNTSGVDRYPADDVSIRWQMMFHNGFAHSSVMIRRDVLASHKLSYNEECEFAQDYELWSRILEFGCGANIDEPLIRYRCHGLNAGDVFMVQQQGIACRVAIANMKRFGFEISTKGMTTLRQWYSTETVALCDDFIEIYGILLKALERFSYLHHDEKQSIARIRRCWMVRCLAGFPYRKLLATGYCRLLLNTLFLDPLWLLGKIISLSFCIPSHRGGGSSLSCSA